VMPSSQVNANAIDALPALEMIGGDLTLSADLPIALRSLTHIGGSLTILEDGVALSSLDRLRSIGGSLRVFGTSIAGVLPLPALQNVSGTLSIVGNPDLNALDFSALREVGSLEIKLNPALSRCQVDALSARVVSDAEPARCCNLGCEVCNGSVCARFGDPTAGQSGVLTDSYSVTLPVRAYTTVVKADQVRLVDRDGLAGSGLRFALREVGSLNIYYTSWTDLTGFRIGELLVFENTYLSDVSALDPAQGALEELRGPVSIVRNARLPQPGVVLCRAGTEKPDIRKMPGFLQGASCAHLSGCQDHWRRSSHSAAISLGRSLRPLAVSAQASSRLPGFCVMAKATASSSEGKSMTWSGSVRCGLER